MSIIAMFDPPKMGDLAFYTMFTLASTIRLEATFNTKKNGHGHCWYTKNRRANGRHKRYRPV